MNEEVPGVGVGAAGDAGRVDVHLRGIEKSDRVIVDANHLRQKFLLKVPESGNKRENEM